MLKIIIGMSFLISAVFIQYLIFLYVLFELLIFEGFRVWWMRKSICYSITSFKFSNSDFVAHMERVDTLDVLLLAPVLDLLHDLIVVHCCCPHHLMCILNKKEDFHSKKSKALREQRIRIISVSDLRLLALHLSSCFQLSRAFNSMECLSGTILKINVFLNNLPVRDLWW